MDPEPEFERARNRMVDYQIAARGVNDVRVLAAMREIPRHLFVPQAYRPSAYEDRPLPIGEGQTISQPFIVGWMTALLELGPADRVLEIGTGSGYQAAILARLAKSVISIERLSAVADQATANLARVGVTNERIVVAHATEGYPPEAP
ncbi:MAG: protein-L-isoaspartate O-methyltransferase, partial [Methanoregulaceae archaeon]|nr:protein-L-isoaspartate O-methyltransferase [Methanoregulaceae archaeon]